MASSAASAASSSLHVAMSGSPNALALSTAVARRLVIFAYEASSSSFRLASLAMIIARRVSVGASAHCAGCHATNAALASHTASILTWTRGLVAETDERGVQDGAHGWHRSWWKSLAKLDSSIKQAP